jgi:hypothetical protein
MPLIHTLWIFNNKCIQKHTGCISLPAHQTITILRALNCDLNKPHSKTRPISKLLSTAGKRVKLGCETLRNPHFLDSRHIDGCEIVSLRRLNIFGPGKFLVLISARACEDPRTIVLLE